MKWSEFFANKSRLENNKILDQISVELLNCVNDSTIYKNLCKEDQKVLKKRVFSDDLKNIYIKKELGGFEPSKTRGEIFYNFFGMNKNWKTGRNILGLVMVHCPEYPTYFIPTYSQTSQTGNPGHVKKGEKIRGLLTGGLEGLAVGALVSGEKLKGREMVPYIALGAGLQLLSSLLFPWLGEIVGKRVYKNRVASGKIVPGASFQKKFDQSIGVNEVQKTPPDIPVKLDNPLKPVNPDNPHPPPTFSGRIPYNNIYSCRLKI